MSHLSRFKTLYRTVDAWSPDVSLSSEGEYQSSLDEHLRRYLPKAKIHRERPHFNRRYDIYVEQEGALVGITKTFIELKYNLVRQSQFDLLAGQINDILRGKHNIIIVLCGETRRVLYDQLKRRFIADGYWDSLALLAHPYQITPFIKGSVR
jgi:hypothetical protein